MNPILKFYIVAGLILVSCSDAADIRLKQYKVQGRALYLEHCSSCHQSDGQGLGTLYPPVAQSDYLEADIARAICITKKGLAEEIKVNGKSYNMPMPANQHLSSLEVAEIMTFIYNKWGTGNRIITRKEVEAAWENCDNY